MFLKNQRHIFCKKKCYSFYKSSINCIWCHIHCTLNPCFAVTFVLEELVRQSPHPFLCMQPHMILPPANPRLRLIKVFRCVQSSAHFNAHTKGWILLPFAGKGRQKMDETYSSHVHIFPYFCSDGCISYSRPSCWGSLGYEDLLK